MKKNKDLKLNLGCGPTGIKGWLNYDWGVLPFLSKMQSFRKILVKLEILPNTYDITWPAIKLVDIRKKLPLPNDSVKYIYCSHVLEHFERWEALKILQECKRILALKGFIRVIIPDIKKMISFPETKLNHLWWGYEKEIEPKNFIERFRGKFIRAHKWHYSEETIKSLMNEAGFTKIILCDFRKGKVPDIEKLDLQDHKEHSLYLEATK